MAALRFPRYGHRIAFVAVGDGPQTSWRAPAIGPILGERSADRGWPGLPLGPAVAHAHGEPWDIWVAEIGGGVRRVNKLGEDEPTVAWNEDDRYLAVSGGTGVYVLEVANGQASQVAKAGGFGGIDWTP
jgi:hypothetical protein